VAPLAPDVAPVRPDERLDVAVVADYLRGRVPGTDEPLEIFQFPGGHANLTYLLRYGDTHEYVLRRPPLGPVAPRSHDMVREFRALSALGPFFAPAPRVYVLCEDPAVIGAPFFVMERRHGIVIRRTMPPEIADDATTRRRIGDAAIDCLADLHAVPVTGAVAGLGKPEGFVERQIRGWAERWQRAKTDELPAMTELAAWLVDRIPPPTPATVVHNDFKLDNMMLDAADPGRVVAVLDWDMTTLGDPLIDVGTLLGYWPEATDPPERLAIAMQPTFLDGFPSRAQLIARYAARSGRDLGSIVFFETFALFKLAVVLQQIYVRFVRGQTQDERFAAMGESVRRLADIALASRAG
jgi:aminoglycoside phosphotransferase (APT) family kinase protein